MMVQHCRRRRHGGRMIKINQTHHNALYYTAHYILLLFYYKHNEIVYARHFSLSTVTPPIERLNYIIFLSNIRYTYGIYWILYCCRGPVSC